ncbi:hypothetical protein SAMN02949497_3068 [Methylomagnum ishizawai]|uniref:Uncharacterized protein n=1 Tax=Methylomagnum ishizawai TaxID=1760988 RepID=A0A1Y6D5Q3_9GAMM|nr:hypothetical protein [Methylomagnum ishizawai]SMF95694.1 hypothetical protein SAMN02949497_3068 [Methylomagnum ishizawai]
MENKFLNGCIRLLSGKESLISTLEAKLATEFEKRLFEAAISNLLDAYNPLRFNNFAYATRELVRHILQRLAPDAEVLNCLWYKNETETKDGISRKQRVIYAIQGGLSDKYVTETLKIDTKAISKQIKSVVDNLSKHTHIQEDTIDINIDKQDKYVNETLESVADLFRVIDESRQAISGSLIDHIDQELVNVAISETIGEIDEIATHHTVDDITTEEVQVKAIDSQYITLTAYGSIGAELQYGSNGDLDRGDGAILSHDFPFSCNLKSSVRAPEVFLSEFTEIKVSNDDWYE